MINNMEVYKIVIAMTLQDLETRVNESIEMGYYPIGTVGYDTTFYIQPMILRSPMVLRSSGI